MAYRLEPHETLSEGFGRVAAAELAGARASVEAALRLITDDMGGDRDASVHDARKRLKKLRALVYLVRDDLGRASAKCTSRRLRDAGRALSTLRDAGVMLETLAALAATEAAGPSERALRAARRALTQHQRAAFDPESARRQLERSLEAICSVQGEVASWRLTDRWEGVGNRLRRGYRDGRRAMVQAYGQRPQGDDGTGDGVGELTDERFHTWRKAVKRLWYHLRLLHPLWPPVMTAYAAEAEALAELLGRDNDLAVLLRTLTVDPERFGGKDAVQVLLVAGTAQMSALRTSAAPLGRRLYAERSEAFARRIAVFYSASKTPQQTIFPQVTS
jgi:CHAD domain-containing protein